MKVKTCFKEIMKILSKEIKLKVEIFTRVCYKNNTILNAFLSLKLMNTVLRNFLLTKLKGMKEVVTRMTNG